MGKQSSRIIWGRTGENENEKTPVTLYDPAETIYVKDNYAIVKQEELDEHGKYVNVTRLYICKAIESAGEWDSVRDDWREIRGITTYDTKKEYKKGAKCLYDDFLWTCTHDITKSLIVAHTNDDILVPTSENYWEKTLQTVAVTYHAMDHKEVYYDNGSNSMKWHKAMWFVPDEDYFDEKHDEEIAEWDPMRQYEKGNRVIKTFTYVSGTIKRLYECKVMHTTSGDTDWHVEQWELIDEVHEWDYNVPYPKDTYVIRSDIPVGEFNIVKFGELSDVAYFKAGDKVIHYIDRDDKTSANPDRRREYEALPEWIKTKVEKVGTRVSTLYQLKSGIPQPDLNNFDRDEWIMIGNAFDLFIGNDYEAGDSVIWSYASHDLDSNYSLQSNCVFTAKEALPQVRSDQTPTADPSKWGEPWKQEQKGKPQTHVYKNKKALTAAENDKWRKENWIIQTQKMKSYELDCYGWIWKKLSDPSSGGVPFGYYFTTMGEIGWSHSDDSVTIHGRYATFYTSSTRAIFRGAGTYIIGSFGTWQTVTSGSGFTRIKTFMSFAYGLPDWKWGEYRQDIAVTTTFFFIRLFDGWQKITLDNRIYLSCFTPCSTGLTVFTRETGSGYYDPPKLLKLILSPDSLIAAEPILYTSSLTGQVSDYESIALDFSEGTFVFVVAKKIGPKHFNINSYDWDDDSAYPNYTIVEHYIVSSSGSVSLLYTEPYLFTEGGVSHWNDSGPAPDKVYADFLKTIVEEESVIIDSYNDSDLRIDVERWGFDTLAASASLDNNVLTQYTHYYDPTHSIICYRLGGYRQKIYTIVHEDFTFYNSSKDVRFDLHMYFLEYNFSDTTQYRTTSYRSDIVLNRYQNSSCNRSIIYSEEVVGTDNASGLDLRPYGYNSANVYPIGKVNDKFYFVNGPSFNATPAHEGSHEDFSLTSLWAFDITSNSVTKLKQFSTAQEYNKHVFIKNIKYINNGTVYLDDYWGTLDGESRVKKVTRLNLRLMDTHHWSSNNRLHELDSYDPETETITMYIPIKDDNLFSIAAGSPASVYTGCLFLQDYFSLLEGFGIYVYIPYFDILQPDLMSLTSFFWISRGTYSYETLSSGNFYGGSNNDQSEFDFPLVF